MYKSILIIILKFRKTFLNYFTPAPHPTLSTANEGTASETFRFGGLRRKTTLDEIESYFNVFGQVTDCEIELDGNGKRQSTFTVTSSSQSVITWLSSTSVHTVGASECTKYKRKS